MERRMKMEERIENKPNGSNGEGLETLYPPTKATRPEVAYYYSKQCTVLLQGGLAMSRRYGKEQSTVWRD